MCKKGVKYIKSAPVKSFEVPENTPCGKKRTNDITLSYVEEEKLDPTDHL